MSRFIVVALLLAFVSTASALNCSYGSPDYFVPYYSNEGTSVTSTAMYFVVRYNAAALEVTPSFDGANGTTCLPVYNYVADPAAGGCNNSLLVNMSVSASTFTDCGFQSSATSTTAAYTGRFKLTIKEQAGVLRGVTFNRTVESAILFRVEFATVVNATSSNVSVYGSAAVQAAITSQTFDSLNNNASIVVTTSVQYPYVLTDVSSGAADPANLHLGVIGINGNCSGVINGSCFQTTNVFISVSNACTAQNTLIHSGWVLNFTVSCDATRINCTGTPSPLFVQVSFDTASPDFCPQVIGTLTPTLTVTPYDGNNVLPQSFFVWGAKSYFRASLNSPVDVEAIGFTKINLATGARAGFTSDLYSNIYTSSIWWASSTPTYYNDATLGANTVADVGMYSGANTSSPIAVFSIVWSSNFSGATGDDPIDTTVFVECRIKYTGSSGSAERTIREKIHSLADATPSSMGSSANVGVARADTTPVSTAARSSSSSNLAIIAVASVGGAIAVLSVFAIVAIKKRRNSKEQQEKMESVYLSRLETPAQTA